MIHKIILIICILLLLVYVALFICFVSIMNGADDVYLSDHPIFLKPFLIIATQLRQKCSIGRNAAWIQKQARLKRQFRIINPSESTDKQWDRFQSERLSYILFCLFAGLIFCAILTGSKLVSPILKEGYQLERTEYGMGKKEIDLIAAYQGMKEKIHLVVNERVYTDDEIKGFLKKAEKEIPEQMLGDNTSLEHVSADLKLMKELEGTPFSITWEMSDYRMMDLDGTLHNEQITESEVVTLTATLMYLDQKYYIPIHVVVEPKIFSTQELLSMEISDSVEKKDCESASKKIFTLPDKTKESGDSEKIQWEEEPSFDCIWVGVLTVFAALAVYISKGNELEKKLKARERELAMDYSEMIHKLILYMNAGMTIRNTFFKLKDDYIKRNQSETLYLYEEIKMTCYEIQTGISETEAYENLGKRCGLRQYVRLSALLNQNLKKGSTNLIETLQQEAKDAFDARKNMARRLGEEAGTKMLGPMIMMLGVVLIMIMIPAYLSFSM